MSADFTPGPWFIDPDDRDGMEWNIHICSDEARNNRICFMASDGKPENAHLIAAAPDLYEALLECLREHGGFFLAGECERRARAALAKARGESP